MPHLFEFMDLEWLPCSLRGTLREIVECACSRPFRSYYDWVADSVLRAARAGACTTLVELGAGPAPITRLLARDPRADGLRLVPCDKVPDRAAYASLERTYPGKVLPRLDSVDFSIPQRWEPGTLLYLSATFHHIPAPHRPGVLQSLTASADRVMVFEPLRKNLGSMLFVIGAVIPALATPIRMVGRQGRTRRFLWCWLLPIAPSMFIWETFVSCSRMWRDRDWSENLRSLVPLPRTATISNTFYCQVVDW